MLQRLIKGIPLVLFTMIFVSLQAQTPGCTDPLATNYNSNADVNNGSCLYNSTAYTPPIITDPISDSLHESSGLQMAGGSLWSINDRANSATLFRIDTNSNAVLQRVILKGITNTDWEDIAFDGTYFYIGDFGNNLNGARTDLKIYKFLFSDIHNPVTHPADTIQPSRVQVIRFTYSDQPQPPVSPGNNNTPFDCEAMLVDNNKIHLFSKNWTNNTCTHYIIPSVTAGNYTATPVETLNTGYLVSAVAKVTGEDIVVVLGYQNSGVGSHFMHVLSDFNGELYFSGNKRKLNLPDALTMGQAEGICFRSNRYGYISNEKFDLGFPFTINQKLRSFDIRNFTGTHFTQYQFTGNGNWSDTTQWINHIAPPIKIYPGNEILINPAAGGSCLLDMPYTMPAGSKLTVLGAKKFIVNGHLTLQQ